MDEKIGEIKSLLGLNYFIHERIFKHSKNGYISEENMLIVIRRSHNIPKNECQIVVRSLEILGLIERDGRYFRVRKPNKSRDYLILEFKKRLNLV